jgi:spore maturation protein CgeB
MKILYLGTLEWGSTSLQRFEGLKAFPVHAYGVDLRLYQGEYVRRGAWKRVQIRFGFPPLTRRIGNAVVFEALRYRPDILWVDQGTCLPAWALRRIRENIRTICIHYTPDSLKAPGWKNPCFRKAVKEYDLCFTTKPQDSAIYESLGARRIHFLLKGYDPRIHRPVTLSPPDQERFSCDVGFSGQRMKARARSLCHLLDKVPCKLNLYGRHWEKGKTGPFLGSHQKGWVYGDDYSKAIAGAKISLAFLNQEVGDTFTTRSFEIPACGGFLLAERTEIHQSLYQEDQEAVFFSSDQELADKVHYYLKHEEERLRIARAGYEKVTRGKHSWEESFNECLLVCKQLLLNRPESAPGSPESVS